MEGFLSTLPARGATGHAFLCKNRLRQFLSTLPARGATASTTVVGGFEAISIHAPREGSDLGQSAL